MESQSGKTLYILKIAEASANGTPINLDGRQPPLQTIMKLHIHVLHIAYELLRLGMT